MLLGRSILLRLPTFAPDGALGSARWDAKQSQVLGNLRAPVTQRRLLDIQTNTLLTNGLQDEVNMRMRLIGVQDKRVPMLKCKLLAREVAHRRQHFVRWRSGRHREHKLVNQLRRLPASRRSQVSLTPHIIDIEIPVLKNRLSDSSL